MIGLNCFVESCGVDDCDFTLCCLLRVLTCALVVLFRLLTLGLLLLVL